MKRLGQLEAEVMQRLWDWDRPAVVRDVLEDLQKDRAIAYTTVMTVLDNLHSKGLVERQKDGRAYRYSPTLTREAHTAGLLEDVLSQSPDRGATLLNFVEQMPAEDLAELRNALSSIDVQDSP